MWLFNVKIYGYSLCSIWLSMNLYMLLMHIHGGVLVQTHHNICRASKIEIFLESLQIHSRANLFAQIPPAHARECPPQSVI